MSDLMVSWQSLSLAFSLVLLALALSYRMKLRMGKEMLVAVFRMIVQLIVVGFLLGRVFQMDQVWITLLLVLLLVFNAALNATKRAKGLSHALLASFLALGVTTAVNLLVLVATGSVAFIPAQVIPISGMIAGNAMKAVGLSYSNMRTLFHDRKQPVMERLSLGATPAQASEEVLRAARQAALQPTIDTVRTVGLVTLPGMMSGLMFAGVDPTKAIMYQIMVYFFILSGTFLSVILSTRVIRPSFFNDQAQLIDLP